MTLWKVTHKSSGCQESKSPGFLVKTSYGLCQCIIGPGSHEERGWPRRPADEPPAGFFISKDLPQCRRFSFNASCPVVGLPAPVELSVAEAPVELSEPESPREEQAGAKAA